MENIALHPGMMACFFDYCHRNDEFTVNIGVADTDLEADVEVALSDLEEYYDEKAFWVSGSTKRCQNWGDSYDFWDASEDDLADYLKDHREGVLVALGNIIRWRAESEAKEAATVAAAA